MTEKVDEAAPDRPADVPPTRKHELPTEGEPPVRESHLSLDNIAVSFPDDGPLSRGIRSLDDLIGRVEQTVLFALLATVVVVAASAALSDKLFHHQFGRWWFTIVRGGTFSIAMFGAVFATHQMRHLQMDLVSRRMPPRGRLILGIVLKLFTIAIAALLFRSGLHQRETVGGIAEEIVSDKTVVTALPIGAVLIMLHCALHIVIDADYLARGKLPPERARSGH